MNTVAKKTLNVGDKIPPFILQDQYGKDFNVGDYLGKNLVIYFYPKDESAVCTKEACAFRDRHKDFEEQGAVVIGINSGSINSHLKFSKNNHLNFTLLSDTGNKVLKSFGVKNVLFLTGRETFIVDGAGLIVYKYRSMLKGDAHMVKALGYLKSS